MAPPSKSYVAIADTQVDPDSPVDTLLMTGLRDNIIHLREWLGLNFTAAVDHNHDGVNSKVVGIIGDAPAVGDYVTVANDDEVGVDPPGYTKCKETLWKGQAGAFRVKFSMRSPGGNLLYGRVYRNGAAVGTERSTSSTTNVEFSEDISGWSPGDLVQVYIYRSAGTGVCYASRLRLCVASPAIGGGKHGN